MRSVFFDLPALGPQQLRQPAAFADGDEVMAGLTAFAITLRFYNEVLQRAVGGDAGCRAFDFHRSMLGLAHTVRGLLSMFSGTKISLPLLGCGFLVIVVSSFCLRFQRKAALKPCPPERPGRQVQGRAQPEGYLPVCTSVRAEDWGSGCGRAS